MFTIIFYLIIIGFIIWYINIYKSIRTFDEGQESKTNSDSVILGIGALVIPVIILIIYNSIYIGLRGDPIDTRPLDHSISYYRYRYDEIAEIISFFFCLVAFMYFVILYDRRKRKNSGNSLLISVCIILTLANACTRAESLPTSDEPNPSREHPYFIHF